MGWTYLEAERGKKSIDILRDEMSSTQFLAVEQIGSTIYAAIKLASEPGRVLGLVALIHRRGGRCNFGYKLVSEDMGPCESEAPASILNKLTNPAPNEWARQWRERCRAHNGGKAARVEARLAEIIGAERAQAECRGLFD
jgi:hypothetical protein